MVPVVSGVAIAAVQAASNITPGGPQTVPVTIHPAGSVGMATPGAVAPGRLAYTEKTMLLSSDDEVQ